MTIQEAIKKAIEGGWSAKGLLEKPEAFYEFDKLGTLYEHSDVLTFYWAQKDEKNRGINKKSREMTLFEVFLDPLFWSSLGKAMGWEAKGVMNYRRGYVWLYHWYRFIGHLAEGKSIEDFFTQLEEPK